MDDFIFLFLYIFFIFLFLLGVVQVLLAIGLGLTTRSPLVRMHSCIYGLGVVSYFTGLYLVNLIPDDQIRTGLHIAHFFGGAFTLAFYHIYIFRNRHKL